MSFCRLGPDSDVYCYYHVDGFYVVWSRGDEHYVGTAQQVVTLLKKLRAEGEKVPDYVFEELEEATP